VHRPLYLRQGGQASEATRVYETDATAQDATGTGVARASMGSPSDVPVPCISSASTSCAARCPAASAARSTCCCAGPLGACARAGPARQTLRPSCQRRIAVACSSGTCLWA